MKKKYLAYWIVHNGNLFERRPELIVPVKVEIDPDFDQLRLVFGSSKIGNDWPQDVRIIVSGSQMVDLLLCTPWMSIVSERAANIIKDLAKEEAEFLPVKVIREDGSPFPSMNYWAINVHHTLSDVLDWEHTRWTTPEPPPKDDPDARFGIILPSFYAHRIEGSHIFRINVVGEIKPSMYMSRTLKRNLQKAKCTIGFEFCPLRTT